MGVHCSCCECLHVQGSSLGVEGPPPGSELERRVAASAVGGKHAGTQQAAAAVATFTPKLLTATFPQ